MLHSPRLFAEKPNSKYKVVLKTTKKKKYSLWHSNLFSPSKSGAATPILALYDFALLKILGIVFAIADECGFKFHQNFYAVWAYSFLISTSLVEF